MPICPPIGSLTATDGQRGEKKDPRAAAQGQTTQPSAVAWKEPLTTSPIESKRGRRPGRPATHRQATREIRDKLR